MEKFCGKCGAELDKKTGRCPNCDADGMLYDKPRNEKKKRPSGHSNKRTGHRLLKVILLILVLLFLIICVLMALFHFNILPVQNGGNGGNSSDIYTTEDARRFAEQSESVDYDEETGTLYMNNRILVIVEEETEKGLIEDMAESNQAELDSSMADIGIYALILDSEMSYGGLRQLGDELLRQYDFVEDVYQDVIIETFDDTENESMGRLAPVYPSDPWDGAAWDTSVPAGANWGIEAIHAPEAWNYRDKMSTVRIGLIDSMPAQSDELTCQKCTNIIIDDATGMQYTRNGLVKSEDHGTHVAGIMNASWDNGQGLSGVMGGMGELYYCAVNYELNGEVYSKYYTAYSYMLALKNLIDDDVQVINISQNTWRLRGFAASHGNENAINYLSEQAELSTYFLSRIINSRNVQQKNDFVICVAAGNSNDTYYYKDKDEPYGYREKMTFWELILSLFGWRGESGGSEAKYNNFLNLIDNPDVVDHIIVVGAVQIDYENSDDQGTSYSYCSFSNIGERVDVVAPGVDVYSTIVSGYDYFDGTSMAAPHVSGVAGLIFAIAQDMDAGTVKEIICETARGEYSNWNYPLIDALSAAEKTLDASTNREAEGYVFNKEGEPLPGVTVSIEETESSDHYSAETHTDSNGYYCIKISDAENYTLTYDLEGYESVRNEVEITRKMCEYVNSRIRAVLDDTYMEVSDDSEMLEFNGHYYKLYYIENITWTEAENFCEENGGHLLTVNSEEEQLAIYQYVERFEIDEAIWIGLSDSETEGDWSYWITGEEVSYTNWGIGEPDDNQNSSADQDYAVLFSGYRSGPGYYIEPGQWDDVAEDDTDTISGFFICEWEEESLNNQ